MRGERTLIGQKASAVLSGGTTTVGMATYFQYMPELCGALASLAGFTLSIVIIYDRIKKGTLEREGQRMKNAILKQQLNRRKRPRKK